MTAHATSTSIRALLARAATATAAGLRRTWQTHRQLLLNDARYAAVVAAIAAAIATQTTLADLLAALLAGVLSIHRTLRHDADQH